MDNCYNCDLFIQGLVIFFQVIAIRNIILNNNLSIMGYYTWIDSMFYATFLFNYFIYILMVVISPIGGLLCNPLTDLEMIKKIQNILEDNWFDPSIIKQKLIQSVSDNETRRDSIEYNETRRDSIEYYKDKDEFTRAITKEDTLTNKNISMRDISGKINFKTNGCNAINLELKIIIMIDKETEKDLKKCKYQFLQEFGNKNEYFETSVFHQYLKCRESRKKYLIKVNGGKCGCIFNIFVYLVISILGYAFIIKLIVRLCISSKQKIIIKKIISSKFDVNSPEVERTFGYDQLSPKFFINNEINDNFWNKLTPTDNSFDKKENLLA